ncbi:MAG: hypothetical protein BGN88_15040, partial [Clostridiales bacterium 43-6]
MLVVFKGILCVQFTYTAYSLYQLALIKYSERFEIDIAWYLEDMSIMQHSKLSDHTYVKGKFITPFNKIMKELSKEESWFHGRLPEYIWLALILKYYGRDEGLIKCSQLLRKVRAHTSALFLPRFSDVLTLPENDQTTLFNSFVDTIDIETLAPLTVVFTYSKYPCFSSFFTSQLSPEERIAVINEIVDEASDHQSEFSTDIRFLVLYYQLLAGRLHMPQETLEMLLEYPKTPHSDEKMRMIRPTVRAMEIIMPLEMDASKEEYSDIFWEGISKLSSCELFSLNISPEHNDTEKYTAVIKRILQYYTDILVAARPLDNKLLVILGIATYSYKRILEVVEHDLYQTIAGRSIVRILVENYIVLKYLIKNESEHDDIWTEY